MTTRNKARQALRRATLSAALLLLAAPAALADPPGYLFQDFDRAAPTATAQNSQQKTLEQIYQPGVNDAFGSQQEDQVLRAARARPQSQPSAEETSRLASTAPMAAGRRDLLGDGGHQDALARQIFPLGTAANDW